MSIIYGAAIFYGVILALFAIHLWRARRRPYCPTCYYPLFDCECQREGMGHDAHVARTLRVVEGGKR